METLKIKNIGEFPILNGFDRLASDPEMTRIANREELSKLPEQIAVNEKVQQKNGFLLQKTEAKKNAGRAHGIIANEQSLLSAANDDGEKNLIRINVENAKKIKTKALEKVAEHSKRCDTCDADLGELNTACKLKRKEYTKNNLIYSHPPKGQIGIFPDGFDISVLKELYKNLENQQIVIESRTIEKEVLRIPDKDPIMAPFLEYVSHRTIEDFRGKQYFYQDNDQNWVESEIITDLGVTVETVVVDEFQSQSIEKADMLPADLEAFRVQNLTPEQKEAEKQAAVDSVLQQSVNMRSGLEIQGIDPAQALSDSQTWYQGQLTLIDAKYD